MSQDLRKEFLIRPDPEPLSKWWIRIRNSDCDASIWRLNYWAVVPCIIQRITQGSPIRWVIRMPCARIQRNWQYDLFQAISKAISKVDKNVSFLRFAVYSCEPSDIRNHEVTTLLTSSFLQESPSYRTDFSPFYAKSLFINSIAFVILFAMVKKT